MSDKIRTLIGSPIRQDYETLDNFINSLKDLLKEGIVIDYFFYR